ncbi:ComEC/Rec2 family competence protein [Ruminococcus sp.]|uniref:ComEC/Rec2 family competence protein n=1 Tax=Ruminococcus sp. TaxID=41978 RepID=UPI003869A88D
MKRPFALIGITYLSVQAVLFYLQQNFVTIVFAIVCFAVAVVSLFAIKKRNARHIALGFCITAALASIIFCGYDVFVKKPVVEKYSDKEIRVTATITEQPQIANDLYRYTLKTECVNGNAEKIKISLSVQNKIKADEFDKIVCTLPVTECKKKQELGEEIFLKSAVYENFNYSVVRTEKKPLYYYAIRVRESFADSLEQLLPSDCASLCRAVLLGEKSAMSQQMQNNFTRCGVSFLIVVSGMHLAIICSFVYFCIKKGVKNRVVRSVIMLLCAFAFMAVSGFSPSVVRAGVMLAVVYSGKMFMRKGDSLNSLGIAALILTVPNPMAVADVGMLLSFAATLGIILWAQRITNYAMNRLSNLNRLKKPVEFIVNLFAVSISASVWTMPFSVLLFGRFSAFSVLLSVLLSPVVSMLIVFALPAVIFNSIAFMQFLAYPLGMVCGLISRLVIWVVTSFSGVPLSSINARKPYFYIWLALGIIMVIAGCFVKNKASYALKSAMVSLCVLILGFGIYSVIDVNSTQIKIYATGGNTVMIKRGLNCSVLSCGGSVYNINSAVYDIMEDTSKLDFIIVPSGNATNTLYADIMQRKFDESDVLIYDNKGENKGFGCRKYFTARSFTININSNTVDEIVAADSGMYQYITTGSTSVLLIDGKCNTENILGKHRNADYIITEKLTDDIMALNCGKMIVTKGSNGEENFDNVVFVQEESLALVLD